MTQPSSGTGRPTAVVAVTGGIAAYKACEVVRRLQDREFEVRVVLTAAASQFVGPTTFAALSGHRVLTSLWDDPRPQEIPHVRWAEACDLFCVVPATADFLAKMAHGIADDLPSTLHLAVTAPILVAPAMEDDMYRHPAVQSNLRTLRDRGVGVVGPDRGALASGRRGPGRMAAPAAIVDAAERLRHLGPVSAWLAGRRVLITAGPTHEAVDPIRVLTNRSSGRMGYTLAAEAALLGGTVELVSGPTALEAPPGVSVTRVDTAADMAAAVAERADDCDVAVLAAAVADFTPAEKRDSKIKKSGRDALELRLERTEDILAQLRQRRPDLVLVGFAAETEDVEDRARDKLESKGCDLIVANRVGEGGAMGALQSRVVILDRRGGRRETELRAKPVIAGRIWDAVHDYLQGEDGGTGADPAGERD